MEKVQQALALLQLPRWVAEEADVEVLKVEGRKVLFNRQVAEKISVETVKATILHEITHQLTRTNPWLRRR